YTTTANNNIYGTLVSQQTVGESYNRIYDPTNPEADNEGYALLTVGIYTTNANVLGQGVVDGFGTVLETITEGESRRKDQTGAWMATGAYTTTANNNIYGTLVSQQTVGESYNRIYDPTNPEADNEGYALLTVGIYTTNANVLGQGVVDGFGTVLETITEGESRRKDQTGAWMATGAYTTTANNNIYGTLVSQQTVGESYNRIYDPTNPEADNEGYALSTVGIY
ncbi:MAG: hypothetical protein GY836_18060, partial [Herbaspirillum sp.]|uniref:hypothetical protein n=1 Tax=Herbaspirillum sp. TaxID=1890675 RepID=UPI0025853D74